MTYLNSWKKKIINKESYTQQKYPSKLKKIKIWNKRRALDF